MLATIPTWALPSTPDAIALYETIELSDMTGKWLRLSADTQRKIMGFAVFGKQQFMIDTNGILFVKRSTCFGMCHEQGEYQISHLRAHIDGKDQIIP